MEASELETKEIGILDSYRSRAVVGCIITFTITSSVSIILRLMAKRMNKTKLYAEDWVILAAQLAVYGMAACSILEVVIGGAGHHARDVPYKIVPFLKVLVAMQVFYATTLGLIKVSICLFLIRIFAVRKFRIWAWLVVCLIVGWSFMVICSAFLFCTPVAFNWDNTIQGGKCVDQRVGFIMIGCLDLIIDIMVFVLPLPIIWGLHLPMANKIALAGIFTTGVVTMIISCLRIYTLDQTDYTDITWTAAYTLLWSFSEPAIGISVACAPLLRPLFKNNVFRRILSRTKGNSTDGNSSFRRLQDGYNLTPLKNGRGTGVTTISSSAKHPVRLSMEDWERPLGKGQSGIMIQREFGATQNLG